MNKDKRLKLNIIFIISYLVFILIFPLIKNIFNITNVPAPEIVLDAADSSTNSFFSASKNFFDYFRNKKYLLEKINKLEKDIESERNKNVILKESYINDNNKNNIIIAKKIFSDFTSIYSTVLLDKGMDSGVEEGDLVFIEDDKAIGKIYSVNKETSLVSLFSRDKNKINAFLDISDIDNTKQDVLFKSDEDISFDEFSTSSLEKKINIDGVEEAIINASKVAIDLYGYGGGDFIAKIPKSIIVSINSIVYLSEDDTKKLGEVVAIEKEEASFFQFLIIRGYYNKNLYNSYYIKHK